MKCITCNYWIATNGSQCEACAGERCRTARMAQHAAPIHHTRQQCCYSHANVPAVTPRKGRAA